MNRITTTAAIAVAAGLAASASAIDLYLFDTENLDVICADLQSDGITPNPFYIGTNPAAVIYDGSSLFVAGYRNTTNPVAPAWTASIVKIEDALGARSFRAIPNSQLNAPDFRGYSGMDFLPGSGLAAAVDLGAFGPEFSIQTYDIETQLNPISISNGPAGNSQRGGSGVAWDAGFDGNGFDWQAIGGLPGDGTLDGPIVSAGSWSGDPQGPFGLDPTTLSAGLGQTVYEVSTGGPELRDSSGISGTFWRDMDIRPTDGLIVARANNETVIATRNSSNGEDVVTLVLPPSANSAAFVNGQNCEILHGFPGGDVILASDRGSNAIGQAMDSIIFAFDETGAIQPINYFDDQGNALGIAQGPGDDGQPGISINSGNGYYSYSWDEPSQTLVVCDFQTRNAYFFSPTQPSAPCIADLTTTGAGVSDPGYGVPDGQVTGADIQYYVNFWVAGDASIADLTTTGAGVGDPGYGVPDGQVTGADIQYYVNFWVAGCP